MTTQKALRYTCTYHVSRFLYRGLKKYLFAEQDAFRGGLSRLQFARRKKHRDYDHNLSFFGMGFSQSSKAIVNCIANTKPKTGNLFHLMINLEI
jgi:hypothetical protein